MRTIYLDVLLIFDLYMNFLLLRLTARLTHTRLSFYRAISGAFVGCLSSLLVLLPPLPWLLSLLCKLIAAALMVAVSFGWKAKRLLVWHFACFLGLSCVVAGMLLALSMTGRVFYTNGVWYPVISLRLLVLFTIAAYLILTLISRIRSRFSSADGSFEVIIRYGGQTVRLEGLCDTGNTLVDFLTGKRVIICPREALSAMLPPEFPCKGFRPLPFSTAAGQGLLYVFTPEEVVLKDLREEYTKTVDVLIGVDEQAHRQAIFHPSLF